MKTCSSDEIKLLWTVGRRQQSVPRCGTPYENEIKYFSIDSIHIAYRIPHLILDNFLKNTQRWTENMCVCVCVCVWQRERERERQKTIHDCNFVSRLYTCRQNYCTYKERINNILEKKNCTAFVLVMRTVIICTCHQILLRQQNQIEQEW